jgi:hypothetical protein
MGEAIIFNWRRHKSVQELLGNYGMKQVQRNPSGSFSKAIQVLQENAEDYASKLTVSTLNREEALISHLQYFIPKIGFTLPTLALMEEQCYKI